MDDARREVDQELSDGENAELRLVDLFSHLSSQ
jgi:hypothetical protein